MERKAWVAALWIGFSVWISGCGTPGAPQPPSLNLPNLVTDLSAMRTGDRVILTWTMPKRNTDRTVIKGKIEVRICRREGGGQCGAVMPGQAGTPGESASYTDSLPAPLASGAPRPLEYLVELQNRKGRSAGLSNAATALAGRAPAPIERLKTEVRKQGVVLSWEPNGESTAVRLERKLLTQPEKSQKGLLAPEPEAANQNFLVETADNEARAIDRSVRFGEKYEYRAQRVIQTDVNGKTLELDGALSASVEVEVKDVFPPSAPTGLVAVATAGQNGGSPAIDLSWQPGTEADLAGYVVYRREDGGEWQRVSPATPVAEPAFHDATVQPGRTYEYEVSAMDKGEHESERSEAARETVPQP